MRNRFVSMVTTMALYAACRGGLFTVRVEDSATTTVSRGTILEDLVGDLGFEDFVTMDVTDDQAIQNQGAGPGDIKDVRFESFELEALTPDGGDLSFLEELELFVESPGLDRVRFAWQDTFPAGQSLVEMVMEDVDLTDYVVSQELTITTDATGHRPEETTEIEARFVLAIGITRQGLCNNL